MDEHEFLNNARNWALWFEMSLSHWESGRALLERAQDSWPAPTPPGEVRRLERDWLPQFMAFAVPAHLLYGYALETAIKATIIRDNPDRVDLAVTINGSGEVVSAKLRGFGVRNWHDLSMLAEVAGLFERDFADDRDRVWLDHFTHTVTWRGRYPVPLEFSTEDAEDPRDASLFAIRNAERWLTNLHPSPLEAIRPQDDATVSAST